MFLLSLCRLCNCNCAREDANKTMDESVVPQALVVNDAGFDFGTFDQEMLAEFDCEDDAQLMATALDAIPAEGIVGEIGCVKGPEDVKEPSSEVQMLLQSPRAAAAPLTDRAEDLQDAEEHFVKTVVADLKSTNVEPKVLHLESSPGTKPPLPFHVDFYEERDRCIHEGKLFEDSEFPAEIRCIFKNPQSDVALRIKGKGGHVVWLRPSQLAKDPDLITSGQSQFDAVQGILGDCWFAAAVGCLGLCEEIFFRVVPPDQNFSQNYAGIFHFQFWRRGEWYDVVIDDRLPTLYVYGSYNLLFMRSADGNEFWTPLIEKAFAKFFGSYEALEGGWPSEACQAFSGGITEKYTLKKYAKEAMFALMVRALEMDAMLTGIVEAESTEDAKRVESLSLILHHTYSVTAVCKVHTESGEVALVRLRNPWGTGMEYSGPWCDRSPEWDTVSEEEKQKLNVQFRVDGEFWMSFDDFVANVMYLDVCYMGKRIKMDQLLNTESVNQGFKTYQVPGNFAEGGALAEGDAMSCVGGSQFLLNVLPDESAKNPKRRRTVLLAVTIAEDEKVTEKVDSSEQIAVELSVFPCSGATSKMDADYFKSVPNCAKCVRRSRDEVTARLHVAPGEYIIVPCTATLKGKFVVRVYASGPLLLKELKGKEEGDSWAENEI